MLLWKYRSVTKQTEETVMSGKYGSVISRLVTDKG